MKVCIVAEGCYPYVVGGVSGWINSLIKSFPNVEFILLAIVANRSFRGKFVYELPENLTQVYEVYLEDSEWEGGDRKRKRRKKVHISRKEYDELLNMVLNRKTDWGVIFDLFHKKRLSVDDLLMGEDFFLIARECYNRNYSNINFFGFSLDTEIDLSANVLDIKDGCAESGSLSLCSYRLFRDPGKYGETFSWKLSSDI